MFPSARSARNGGQLIRSSPPVVAVYTDFSVSVLVSNPTIKMPKGISDSVRHGVGVFFREDKLTSALMTLCANCTQGFVGEDGKRLINLIITHSK